MAIFNNELRAFSAIPNQLIQARHISAQARFLFVIMASKPDGWQFFKGPLMKDMGCSEKSLDKYLGELILWEWLVVEQQTRTENGKFSCNIYTLKRSTDRPEEIAVRQNLPYGKICGTAKITAHNNKDLISKNNLEEGKSLTPLSEQKQTISDFEKFCENFRKSWNKHHDRIEGTETCRFTAMTKRRKDLLRKIWEEYQVGLGEEKRLHHEAVIRGIINAMYSKRARGKAKGMTAPADLNYMLDNFEKLVEGTF